MPTIFPKQINKKKKLERTLSYFALSYIVFIHLHHSPREEDIGVIKHTHDMHHVFLKIYTNKKIGYDIDIYRQIN